MSLYIGNLSARTHRDELERVFRRFGRCSVRMKDGYGFVVYEFPTNAEKALRALQGRNICGESLTLTWSNKQPRPFKRFARAARSYEPNRSGNSARGGGCVNRRLGSNGKQDKMGIKQPDGSGGKVNSADMRAEETSYHQDNVKDYIRENREDFRELLLDEDGDVEPNLLDNDRWGDQIFDQSNDNGVENGMILDRYEPYQGYDRKDEDEIHRMSAPQSSQEKIVIEQIREVTSNHHIDSKPQQTCYSCGGLGHKMHTCPRKNALRRKLTSFDYRHDDDINRRGRGEGELERFGSQSWRNRQSSRDPISKRRLRNDRKASGSGKHQRLIRTERSPVAKETDRAQGKDYGRKKRSKRENGTPKRHIAKKARSVSSLLHSDYTVSSHTMSQSSKPMPSSSSYSRSKLVPSRAYSSSSAARSNSPYSRSRSSKSRSRSSSPGSLSFSVSLGRPLPSTPNKEQLNLKGFLDNAMSPESREIPLEMGQPVEGDAGLENANLENTMVAVNKENAVSSYKVEDVVEKGKPLQSDNTDNLVASGSLYEVKNPSTQLLEKVAPAPGSFFPELLGEMKEGQNSDAIMVDHKTVPIKKLESEAHASSRSGHSTNISSEEMYMVLKHYGLKLLDEDERHLPVETYFGSARLWPWEIIYYRRLKKGPISTENYARRVVQNREFGIVDKYIRSSSGWAELDQDNP